MKKLFGLLFGLCIAIAVVLSTDLEDWNAYKVNKSNSLSMFH